MDVNELRLGNFIKHNDFVYPTPVVSLEYVYNKELDFFEHLINRHPTDLFYPLLINDELLNGMGFLKTGQHWRMEDFELIEMSDKFYLHHKRFILIDSVHKLQNIYFDLNAKQIDCVYLFAK